jgi:uncharacterized cupredoxin-like copper-binding protein
MRGRTFLIVAAGLLLAATAAAATPGSRTAAGATTTVRVTMTEFKFALSRKSVPPGQVSFRVLNKGTTVHDFKIKGKKTPIYAAGKGGTLKVTFAKRGKYAFLCTVPGHASAGMKGVLTVK